MDRTAKHWRFPEATSGIFRGFGGGTRRADDLGLRRVGDTPGMGFDPQSDIRGWSVVNRQGETLGKVSDLIGNAATGDLYFLVAHVGSFLGQFGDSLGLGGKRILIPLDAVHADHTNQRVELDATKEDLMSAPEWDETRHVDYAHAYSFWQGRGTRRLEGERELVGMRGGEAVAETETRVPLREEELVTRRDVRSGEVGIEKHVETEERSIEVPVTHTEVEIERRPVSAADRSDASPIGQEEVRVPITEEEIHVEKRPVVKEEIVVRQHPVTETEHHTETVRREVAEVDREGDVEVKPRGDVDVKTRRDRDVK